MTRGVLANEQLGGFSSIYFLANPAAVWSWCLEKCENLVSVGTRVESALSAGPRFRDHRDEEQLTSRFIGKNVYNDRDYIGVQL